MKLFAVLILLSLMFIVPSQAKAGDSGLPGEHQSCLRGGGWRMCVSVSDATPPQGSTVTVYARLTHDKVGQANLPMKTVWQFNKKTLRCESVTNDKGKASCSLDIGAAKKGFVVNVKVKIDGFMVSTAFIPQ